VQQDNFIFSNAPTLDCFQDGGFSCERNCCLL